MCLSCSRRALRAFRWSAWIAWMNPALHLLRRVYIEPLLEEDRLVLEAEQQLHDANPDTPAPELNPVVRAVHKLAVAHAPKHLRKVA